MTPWILSLQCFTISSRHVAVTRHRLKVLIAKGCNERVVLPNRLELALPALLDVDTAGQG